jgi:hypothetical protein
MDMSDAKHNPKHVRQMKEGKAPLEYLVGSAADDPEAWVLKHGADKYGIRNWRKDQIILSTYVAALRRHTNAIARGELIDPESGLPHAAHIRANMGIVLDAIEHGTLTIDVENCESIDQGDTSLKPGPWVPFPRPTQQLP